jgi:hypothetical protein
MMLTAIPLSLAGLVAFSPSLAESWNEGGWGMYAIMSMVAVGALLSGGAVFLAGRAWPPAAVVVPLFIVLPAALGRASTGQAMHGTFVAVAHAHPADRMTILMGSMAEALWLTIFGGVASAAVAFAAALGLALSGFARLKDANRSASVALLSAAPALLLIAVATVVATSAAAAWVKPFKIVAHMPPEDRIIAVRAALNEQPPREQLRLVLGLLASLGVVGSAVASRRAPVAAGLVGTSGLLTVGLLFGSIRMVPPPELEDVSASETGAQPLMQLNGPPARSAEWLTLGASAPEDFSTRLGVLRDTAAAGAPDSALGITLETTARALEDALTLSAHGGMDSVELVFSPPPAVTPEPPLPSPFHLIPLPRRGVTLGVGTRRALCGEDCTAAVLEKDALVVDGERWALVENPDVQAADATPLLVMAAPYEPRQLVGAALAALQHHRRLVLVVENPPEEAPAHLPTNPRSPLLKASLGKLTVTGPLPARAARGPLEAALPALARCGAEEDAPAVPFTAHLQLGVNASGDVTELLDLDAPHEPQSLFLECLYVALGDAPLPRTPGLSVVTVDVAFKAATGATTKPGE